MENKRIHQRYQIIHEVGYPTQYNMLNHGIPGVLVDLSAGGMAFRSYAKFEPGEVIKFAINIPGLATQQLEGKVEWSKPEDKNWHIGMSFTRIGQADKNQIDKMAVDYNDCKNKFELNKKYVCVEGCSYAPLCNNSAKIKE